MTTTEKLGYSHRPEIELPLDIGDGPFAVAEPATDALAAPPAAAELSFGANNRFAKP